MPSILFITRHHLTRMTGGAEEQCWLLSRELARRGWDAHYVSEMNELPDPPVVDGVRLHGLPENPPHYRGNRRALAALLRALNPDVIYNRSFDVYTRDAMRDAADTTVKVWASTMTGDGFILPRLRLMKKTLTLTRFLRRLPIHFAIFAGAKRAVRRADVILVQRQDQLEAFRRLGIEAALCRNVQPIVPESLVQQHRGRPVILWVASLKSWKRPEKFFDLAARCRDLDADFVALGAVQEAHYHAIAAAAVKATPRLRWEGLVPVARVPDYFARAHLFVNTSIQLEGFPNSFIHAWLHGIPVVSLGVDPEGLLSSGGLGHAAQTPDELERVVRDLIARPDRRREIGARARAFAAAEFDLQRNADRLEQLIAARGVTLPPR